MNHFENYSVCGSFNEGLEYAAAIGWLESSSSTNQTTRYELLCSYELELPIPHIPVLLYHGYENAFIGVQFVGT